MIRFQLAIPAIALAVGVVGCATQGPTIGPRGAFRSKKAPWTIRCLELNGPARLQHIEQVAATLRSTPGIDSGKIRTSDDADGFARLYYGIYYQTRDRNTGRLIHSSPARRDLHLLRGLGTQDGRHLFLGAMIVRQPLPDVGNPNWNLVGVPAVYSLQIAAFEPTESFWNFKRAAVEFCQWLRDKGYEAYYHHSDALSVVTVGTFGSDAITTKADGRTYYSAQVVEMQRDDLLKHNLVNGAVHRIRIPSGEWAPVYSRLVEVPKSTNLSANK